MCQHSKNRPQNSNFVQRKQSKNNHTHMGYTTVSNNFFQIHLTKSSQACVHNTKQTNSTYQRSLISTSCRKLIHIESQQSISSQFQQHSSQLHTSSSTCFNVSFWKPQMQRHERHFHCKSQKETPPQEQFSTRIKSGTSQQQVRSGSSAAVQKQKTRKHSQTSNKCIKNLEIGSTYFSSTASTQSNKKEHRQKCTLIKHIKAQQIQTCKASKQKAFKSQQQPIKRLTVPILGIPTTQNSQRHQKGSKQYHPKAQAVQSKFQLYGKQSIPKSSKSYNLLERFNSLRNKTSPQSHTQNQCNQTKDQCSKPNAFALFPRQYAKNKCTSQRLKQNNSQQSIQRNRRQKGSSSYTLTKHQRPHLPSTMILTFFSTCFSFNF